MKEVAIYEAKTRLSEMLVAIERGEQFTITRRGVPIARLTAVEPHTAAARSLAQQQRQRVRRAIAELREWRRGTTLDIALREAVESGRD